MEVGWWWFPKSRSTVAVVALVFGLASQICLCASLPVLPDEGDVERNFRSPADGDQGLVKQRVARDVCDPYVYGFRLVQSGSVPSLATGDGGSLVATFASTDSRGDALLEVYGACLQDVDELALTLDNSSCETRVGPYQPATRFDNGSRRMRAFSLNLTKPHEPTYSTRYYLCVGHANSALTVQAEAPQIEFVVTPPVVPTVPTWASILIAIVLLMFSGLFSGLNLGLMSLDPMDLKVIMQSGSEKEKRYAKIIQPLRRHGNYLLCTILLGNVIVNATLTNFLDSLTGSGVLAIVVSSGGIVIFGEILPQSVCSRYGLAVGARTIWITRFFMVVTFPLSFPISLVLDKILGEEIGRVFRREQLINLLQVTKDHHDMAQDEMEMLTGVLEFKKKTIEEIMTAKADMFLLDEAEVLNYDTLRMIQNKGHSRIPVHYHSDENDIIGVMFVKDLMFVDPDDNWPVSHIVKLYKHPVLQTENDTKLDVMLDKFKSGVSHMSLVRKLVTDLADRDPYWETIGIVTLEDIIEEIINSEIVDETDRIRDNRTKEPIPRSEEAQEMASMEDLSARQYISKHLMMAAFNFLRTDFETHFGSKQISNDILTRLLANPKVTMVLRLTKLQRQESTLRRRRDYGEQGAAAIGAAESSSSRSAKGQQCLFTAGTRSDCFVLVLEGHVQVELDGFEFEKGPFDSFGVPVLETGAPFVPNFTVRPLSDLIYVRITLDNYKRACKFSATGHAGGADDTSNLSSLSDEPTVDEPTAMFAAGAQALGTTGDSALDADDETPLLESSADGESPRKKTSLLAKLGRKSHAATVAVDQQEMQPLPSQSGAGAHARRTFPQTEGV